MWNVLEPHLKYHEICENKHIHYMPILVVSLQLYFYSNQCIHDILTWSILAQEFWKASREHLEVLSWNRFVFNCRWVTGRIHIKISCNPNLLTWLERIFPFLLCIQHNKENFSSKRYNKESKLKILFGSLLSYQKTQNPSVAAFSFLHNMPLWLFQNFSCEFQILSLFVLHH